MLVLQRQHGRRRVQLRPADRVYWVVLSRLWPRWREALFLVQPETVIAWQRRGFRWYWCWKSQRRPSGRRAVPRAVVEFITSMHKANPTWGAPRIHGELLKLGFELAQSTVSKYLPRRSRHPPSQGWQTFLRNHLAEMIALDFAVVPTVKGQLCMCSWCS